MGRLPNGSGPILVADPDDNTRDLAERVFREAGYSTLEAVSGDQALDLARRERPRVVVLDVCLPTICGYEVCRALREQFGESVSIVFVSDIRKESFDRVAGLLLGADDYLVKPFAGDELLARVRRLIHHATPLTSGIVARLTPREQDVLRLLTQGLTQEEIASHLFISPKTIGTHMGHIFEKLAVRNQTQAVALAFREDLLPSPT